MPEVNAITGNLFENQGLDLLQSCHDRLGVQRGSRADVPSYGFLFGSWPQLSQAELVTAVDLALRSDSRVDTLEFNFLGNNGTIEIIVNSDIRVNF